MTENLASTGLSSLFYADKSKREKFLENPNNKKNREKFQTKTQIKQEIFSLKIKIIKGGGKQWLSSKQKEKP
jgi:hypothetical protein